MTDYDTQYSNNQPSNPGANPQSGKVTFFIRNKNYLLTFSLIFFFNFF